MKLNLSLQKVLLICSQPHFIPLRSAFPLWLSVNVGVRISPLYSTDDRTIPNGSQSSFEILICLFSAITTPIHPLLVRDEKYSICWLQQLSILIIIWSHAVKLYLMKGAAAKRTINKHVQCLEYIYKMSNY